MTISEDAAITIADNLGSLPHPDGIPRRLMQFSPVIAELEAVKVHARDLGTAIVHLLEASGYRIERS